MTARTRSVLAVSAIVALFVPAIAFAQPTRAPRQETANDIAYKFMDDPLSASGADPNGAIIHVHPDAARIPLIRPRLNFVSQLLRSVEGI